MYIIQLLHISKLTSFVKRKYGIMKFPSNTYNKYYTYIIQSVQLHI